jgi:hypothetical protein
MPPSGQCLRHIAPAAAMVNKFDEITQNTNKTQPLASNYGTFRALINSENFIPQNGPSTQLIEAASFVKMWNATIGAEELAIISSYQRTKSKKLLSDHEAWFFSGCISGTIGVKLLSVKYQSDANWSRKHNGIIHVCLNLIPAKALLLTYDTQIMVCPFFFIPPKCQCDVIDLSVLDVGGGGEFHTVLVVAYVD